MAVEEGQRVEGAGVLADRAALEIGQAAVLLHHRHAQLLGRLVEGSQRAGGAHLDALAAKIAVALVEVEHRRARPQKAVAHRGHGHCSRGASAAAAIALEAGGRKGALVLAARRTQQLALPRKGHAGPAHARAHGADRCQADEAAARHGGHDATAPSAADGVPSQAPSQAGRISSTAAPRESAAATSSKKAASDSTYPRVIWATPR